MPDDLLVTVKAIMRKQDMLALPAEDRHAILALLDRCTTAEDANQRNLGMIEACEQMGVELEATKHRLATAEAEIVEMAKGTSHDCDIIADGAETEERLTQERDAARAEVQRLNGMRCDDCKHRFVGMAPAGRPHFTYCKLTKVPVLELGTQTYVMCVVLGNGCLAWEKRDA